MKRQGTNVQKHSPPSETEGGGFLLYVCWPKSQHRRDKILELLEEGSGKILEHAWSGSPRTQTSDAAPRSPRFQVIPLIKYYKGVTWAESLHASVRHLLAF